MERERKTVELCGCRGDNATCVKARGHDGDHDFFPTGHNFELPTERIKPLRR